jgi:nucleoside-diphosphate-sugar epimerase
VEAKDGDVIEVWGNGMQTRSFLYVDECVEAVLRLMESDFTGPVNIGSEEMVTINQLAGMAIAISDKNIEIKNIDGQEFIDKYGFKCPLGVKGRNSDNKLYREKVGWEVSEPLSIGLKKTYQWIKSQVDKKEIETPWIYESPDGGKTVYRREPQSSDRHKIK